MLDSHLSSGRYLLRKCVLAQACACLRKTVYGFECNLCSAMCMLAALFCVFCRRRAFGQKSIEFNEVMCKSAGGKADDEFIRAV